MSANKFINILKQQSLLTQGNRALIVTGIVSGWDPTNYLVSVQIFSENEDELALKTGWMNWLSPWVGDNCGMYAPPNIGDVVLVLYQYENQNMPIGAMACYGDQRRPLPVPSGEFWVVHQSGSLLKFTNDGKVSINGDVEIDLSSPQINITAGDNCNISAGQNCTITSPEINLSGEVNIGNLSDAVQGLMNESFKDVFDTHTHLGGSIPAPDVPTPSTAITSNTRAN